MTPSLTPNAQQLLAQATPQGQAPLQAPQPVAAPQQSIWGKVLQAGLASLAGGIRGATEDAAIQGTGRAYQSRGGAYAAQNLADQQAAQQAAQDRATQQAQQQFEQERQQRADSRAEQEASARLTAAHLQALQTAQAMANLPQEKQDEYYKGQAAAADHYGQDRTPLGVFSDKNTALNYLTSKGKTLSDVQVTHQLNDDGSDRITLWPNSANTLDDKIINARLHNPEDYVAPGTTMKENEATAFINGRNAAHTTSLDAQEKQRQSEAAARQLEGMRQAGEDRRSAAALAAKGDSPSDADIDKAADAIHNGRTAPDQVGSGMGAQAAAFRKAVNLRFLEKYPNENLENLRAFAKQNENGGTQNLLSSGRTLFGTKDKPGTLDTVEEAIKSVPKSSTPWLSKVAQGTAYETGSPEMAALKAIVPDINSELAKFNAGVGGHGSDHQLEEAAKQINSAQTPEQFQAAVTKLRQVGGERLDGILGQNPYLHNSASDIQDPRIGRAPTKIVQVSPSTRMRRQSTDGGKTWQLLPPLP